MSIEVTKPTNFLDTNHLYEGSPAELKKHFVENFESYLRAHLHEDLDGELNSSSEGNSFSCYIPWPYNMTLTLVFHEGNVCTCGVQSDNDASVKNEELRELLQNFIQQKAK